MIGPISFPMNLRSVDLNLLVVLDALLNEHQVTRAAERVGLSQPAMSNALARLRHIFKDELLVRTASGMRPTPRAEALRESIRPLLRQIERVFEADAGFDPARSNRTFAVRLSDLLGSLLLPRLLDDMTASAPGIALDVLHLPPARTVDALERDEIDVAVSMGLEHSGAIRSEVMLRDRMVCIMRRSHALARRELNLESFLAERHLKVSMSPSDLRFVDDVLARQHRKRDVALNVPHWLIVPHLIEHSDFLAVLPRRLATSIARKRFVIRELPFAAGPFEWTLYWHRRHEKNQANSWLRQAIRSACRQLE
jgi:DNA-binding transcriptional LysR family regulator